MNHHQKYLTVRLLAVSALLTMTSMQGVFAGKAPPPPKAPTLGAASAFAELAGSNITCTGGAITGDIGVSPGSAVPYTNTGGCIVTGKVPPATNLAAASARSDFLRVYDALLLRSTSCTQVDLNTVGALTPGVYCVDSVGKTGALTLNGSSTGSWIFLVNGALTGSGFSVNMINGGQACNVWWAPETAVTMTDSTLQGNILAGDQGSGSITFTGGTLNGRALANIAVTTTGTVITRPAVRTGCPK